MNLEPINDEENVANKNQTFANQWIKLKPKNVLSFNILIRLLLRLEKARCGLENNKLIAKELPKMTEIAAKNRLKS